MAILIVNDKFLEFGLDSAYDSFNSTATDFLAAHQISHASVGPASQIMFRFWLAVWSGIIGVYFIFPGLRFAQMHKDALNLYDTKFMRASLHWTFVAPVFVLLLWVRPIARVPLVERSWGGRKPFLHSDDFEVLRLLIALIIPLCRLFLMPVYVQSYLDVTLLKLRNLKKQSGQIKKQDLQLIVSMKFS
jgi:hypothetical protein